MQHMEVVISYIGSMVDVDTLEELLDSVDKLSALKRILEDSLREAKYKVSKEVGPKYGAYHLLTPNIRGIRLMMGRTKQN